MGRSSPRRAMVAARASIVASGLTSSSIGSPTAYTAKNTTTETASSTNRLWISLRRSEEHTSELQSLMRISYAVFCLKKKKKKTKRNTRHEHHNAQQLTIRKYNEKQSTHTRGHITISVANK